MRKPSTCRQCGETFMAWRVTNIYCSPRCCDLARSTSCTRCGAIIWWSGKRKGPAPDLCKRCHPNPTRKAPVRAAVESKIFDLGEFLASLQDHCTITPNGCWEWNGQRDRAGYGRVRTAKRNEPAHRVVLQAVLGHPLGSQAAHHKCANPPCVNPDHLQPVTHSENVAEMMARQSYIARIRELEDALASVAPDHPLLDRIPVR